MKFRLSTLLWCLVVFGVVMGSYVFVQRERDKNHAKLEKAATENQARIDEANTEKETLRAWAYDSIARSSYYKRSLGLFENIQDETKPQAKFIRLPNELGGMQLHGLPFTWRWRFYLPHPNEFELCWATNDIPKGPTFDLPDESIHRSQLNLAHGHPMAGTMGMSDSTTLDGKNPLEVLVYFRIDASEEGGGSVFVNYEIGEPGKGTANYRGQISKISAADTEWLTGVGVSAMGGGYSVSGFGIEHSATDIPLLDGPITFNQPNLLLKVRATKNVGEMKYEPWEGAAPGLMIWVQKRQEAETEEE